MLRPPVGQWRQIEVGRAKRVEFDRVIVSAAPTDGSMYAIRPGAYLLQRLGRGQGWPVGTWGVIASKASHAKTILEASGMASPARPSG